MASCKTFVYADAIKMLRHTNRKHEQTRDGHINTVRSFTNKRLSPLRNTDDEEYLLRRINEVPHVNRSTLKVMASWVVTVPKDFLSAHTERVGEFFETVYAFLAERYGEINVISSYVHYDEATPHMHFNFVPVVSADNGEKICASECIPYGSFGQFHWDMKEYLDRHFGFSVGVAFKAVRGEGDLSVLQLKVRTEKDKLEKLTAEAERIMDALGRYDSLSHIYYKETEGTVTVSKSDFKHILDLARRMELYAPLLENISNRRQEAETLAENALSELRTAYDLMRINTSETVKNLSESSRELSEKAAALERAEALLKENTELYHNLMNSADGELSEQNVLLSERVSDLTKELIQRENENRSLMNTMKEEMEKELSEVYGSLDEKILMLRRENELLRLQNTISAELESLRSGGGTDDEIRLIESTLDRINSELSGEDIMLNETEDMRLSVTRHMDR